MKYTIRSFIASGLLASLSIAGFAGQAQAETELPQVLVTISKAILGRIENKIPSALPAEIEPFWGNEYASAKASLDRAVSICREELDLLAGKLSESCNTDELERFNRILGTTNELIDLIFALIDENWNDFVKTGLKDEIFASFPHFEESGLSEQVRNVFRQIATNPLQAQAILVGFVQNMTTFEKIRFFSGLSLLKLNSFTTSVSSKFEANQGKFSPLLATLNEQAQSIEATDTCKKAGDEFQARITDRLAQEFLPTPKAN